MPADLAVALAGGGAVFEVHALEDGVFAVAVLDGEEGFLNLALAGLLGLVGGAAGVLGGIVGEEIKLLGGGERRNVTLAEQAVGGDGKAAHQQKRIGDAVEDFRHSLNDAAGGGGVALQRGRAGGFCGHSGR